MEKLVSGGVGEWRSWMDGVMCRKAAMMHSGSLRLKWSCRKVRIRAAVAGRPPYRWFAIAFLKSEDQAEMARFL